MPVTGVTFSIGALALAGVSPLAGFFAKDEILAVANNTGHQWLFVLGIVGALLSALYIGRLVFLTFFGRPRSEEAEHAHESSPVMTLPLVVLAVGAAFAGLLDPTLNGLLSQFLEPVLGVVPEGTAGISRRGARGDLVGWSRSASGSRGSSTARGGSTGWRCACGCAGRSACSSTAGTSRRLLRDPGHAGQGRRGVPRLRVRRRVCIDGGRERVGRVGERRSRASGRRLQTGLVRTYALAFLAGAVGVLVFVGFRL